MTEKTDLVRILERVQAAAQSASRFVGGDARFALLALADGLEREINFETKLHKLKEGGGQ